MTEPVLVETLDIARRAEIVALMRQRSQLGATGRALALEYRVSGSLVTEILRGNRWASAGGPLRTRHGNTKHGRFASR